MFEGKTVVPIAALWHALITGLSVIWPSRLSLAGISLGDVWPCSSLKNSLPKDTFEEGDDLVPFHKLTGWTTYSLLEPMEKILGWKFDGIDDMTGLPEYRNGELVRFAYVGLALVSARISRDRDAALTSPFPFVVFIGEQVVCWSTSGCYQSSHPPSPHRSIGTGIPRFPSSRLHIRPSSNGGP